MVQTKDPAAAVKAAGMVLDRTMGRVTAEQKAPMLPPEAPEGTPNPNEFPEWLSARRLLYQEGPPEDDPAPEPLPPRPAPDRGSCAPWQPCAPRCPSMQTRTLQEAQRGPDVGWPRPAGLGELPRTCLSPPVGLEPTHDDQPRPIPPSPRPRLPPFAELTDPLPFDNPVLSQVT